jgi:serine-type D-Ala-D-Ala endopeptidase (penicillin-binding protein 7)
MSMRASRSGSWGGALVAILLLALPLPAWASTSKPSTSKPSAAAKASAPRVSSTKARTTTPDVRSAAVLVVDRADGSVIFSRKAEAAAPIASITKLMTALVVLEGKQPLDELVEITTEDRSRGKGAPSRLAVGTKLSRSDLLHVALMSSENRAAHALGRSYPGGERAFVRAMNAKAKALGMTQSRFADPTGLSSSNVSTPRDLAKLVIATSRNDIISEYSTSVNHEVRIGRTVVQYRNTNSLVRNPSWSISLQKTGYISEAGQCLVMQAEIDGRPVIMVLLNSFGKYTRVADAKRIRQWMESRTTRSLARAGS